MSKLQPAPLKFPNGGGLKAMAERQSKVTKLQHQQIDLKAKIARARTTDPDELQKIDLEAQIAHSKVKGDKPAGMSPAAKKPKPQIITNKPLKGV